MAVQVQCNIKDASFVCRGFLISLQIWNNCKIRQNDQFEPSSQTPELKRNIKEQRENDGCRVLMW